MRDGKRVLVECTKEQELKQPAKKEEVKDGQKVQKPRTSSKD